MRTRAETYVSGLEREHGSEAMRRVRAYLEGVDDTLTQRPHARPSAQRGAVAVTPGLQAKPWHDPREHRELAVVLAQLEAAHGAIKAEYRRATTAGAVSVVRYPHPAKEEEGWNALYLYAAGSVIEENCAQCPVAGRILREHLAPLLLPGGEFHFSILAPGSSIPAHHDPTNLSLNVHFAIDVPYPEQCWIRVGAETRRWEEGKSLVFDYTFEHEAYNGGPAPRVILLADVWHPDLTPVEREAFVALRRLQVEALTREAEK